MVLGLDGSKASKRRKVKVQPKTATRAKAGEKAKTAPRKSELDLDADEAALVKEFGSMGAVTPYSVASKLDLKLSAAKALLRKLAEKDLIELAGGNTRLRIYKVKD